MLEREDTLEAIDLARYRKNAIREQQTSGSDSRFWDG
jgi:hypothetical protein